jgi:hypothetical protein
VVGDLVTGNVEVGDKGIVGVVKGGIVGNLWLTPIRVFTMSKELVNGIKSVGLHSIIGSIDNKLRDLGLPNEKSDKRFPRAEGGRHEGLSIYGTETAWWACASAIAVWKHAG